MKKVIILLLVLTSIACQKETLTTGDTGSVTFGVIEKKSGTVNHFDYIPDNITQINTVVTNAVTNGVIEDEFILVTDASGADQFIIDNVTVGTNNISARAISYDRSFIDNEDGFWVTNQFESYLAMGTYNGWRTDEAQGFLLQEAIEGEVLTVVEAMATGEGTLPTYIEYTGKTDFVVEKDIENSVIVPMRTVFGRIIGTISFVNPTYADDWEVSLTAVKDDGTTKMTSISKTDIIEGFYWSASDATDGRTIDIIVEWHYKNRTDLDGSQSLNIAIEGGVSKWVKISFDGQAMYSLGKKSTQSPCKIEVY